MRVMSGRKAKERPKSIGADRPNQPMMAYMNSESPAITPLKPDSWIESRTAEIDRSPTSNRPGAISWPTVKKNGMQNSCNGVSSKLMAAFLKASVP